MDDKIKSIPVEVYLPSAVFRGQLLLRHNRLSDSLNSKTTDGVLRLDDVEIENFSRNASPVKSRSVLIYTRQITFVVDLSPSFSDSGKSEEISLVNKEARQVLMEVGLFWMQGDVHVVPGLEFTKFAEAKSLFIPLTNARFIDFPDSPPRTFMINREKLNCLMDLPDVVAANYPAATKQRRAQTADRKQSFHHS